MTDYKPPSSVSRPHIAKTEEPERGVRELRGGKNRVEITKRTEAMLDGTYEEPEPEPVKPEPKPEPEEEELYFDETKEFEEALKMPWEDGDGSPYAVDQYVSGRKKKDRVNIRRTRPVRGNETMIRGLRP